VKINLISWPREAAIAELPQGVPAAAGPGDRAGASRDLIARLDALAARPGYSISLAMKQGLDWRWPRNNPELRSGIYRSDPSLSGADARSGGAVRGVSGIGYQFPPPANTSRVCVQHRYGGTPACVRSRAGIAQGARHRVVGNDLPDQAAAQFGEKPRPGRSRGRGASLSLQESCIDEKFVRTSRFMPGQAQAGEWA